jgi:restriction system protein
VTVPSFDTFFRPFLELLSKQGPLHMKHVQASLQSGSGLSPDDLAQRLPSGGATVIENRIGWARTYLFKAGLIERVSWGSYRISASGIRMLKDQPGEITLRDLRQIPALQEWMASSAEPASKEDAVDAKTVGPATKSEQLVASERLLRALVEDDLRERMSVMSPVRFEWLVEQLVVKLGYGASDLEVRAALSSGSGDGGVDGVIKEDRLGLGQIYLQAKRWSNTVGRPAIQAFVGAMHGRAQKGVFITTSEFSREAREYADSLHGLRLRLIDGRELASLMVDCGLGVSEERTYRTYRVDTDFFEAEE